MCRSSPFVITLPDADRAELERRARCYTLPHVVVVRAKIVLLAAEGLENTQIAARLDVHVNMVSRWRGCPTYTIDAGPNMGTGAEECIASTNSTNYIVLKPCTGSTGVNWSLLCNNPSTCSHWVLINNYASNTTAKTVVLSGDSTHGDRVVPNCWQCTAGQLQQWDLL